MKETRSRTCAILFSILTVALGFGNFNYKIGFSIKPYMIISLVTLLLTLKYNTILKLKNYEKVMCLYFLFYIFTIIQVRYFEEGLWYSFVILLVLSFYFIYRRIIIYVTLQDIEKAIFYGGLIISISSLIYYYIGIASMNFIPSETNVLKYGVMIDRFMFRLMGTVNEPNIASIYFCFFLFFYLYNFKISLLHKVGFILNLIAIILTLSRGAYISIIGSIICVTLLNGHITSQVRKLLRNTILFSLVIILLYTILLQYDIDILEPIFNRFDNISEDSGSGRLELWECAFKAFLSSPLWGIGLNGIRSYNIEHFGVEMGNFTHNSYLEVLAEAGMIGLILYLTMIFLVIYKLINLTKSNKNILYLLATFICVLFQIIFISVQHNEMIYFFILLTFRYDINNNLVKKEKLLSNLYIK